MFSITYVMGDQRNDPLQVYFADSLAYYEVNNQLVSYLELLDKTHNYFLKNKEFNEIKSMLDYYELFRLPNTDLEKSKARYSFTLYAFTYYKKLEDHLTALKFYELAHDNLDDKLNGDKFSWYIENVIGNIYTRLEQYEKAEYYLNIVERYLKATENNRNLSRLYINKSRALNAQQKTLDAISVLNKAHKLYTNDKVNASLFLNLADLYISMGEPDSCQIYLDLFDGLDEVSKKEYLYYYWEIQGDKYVEELKVDRGLMAYDQSYEFLIEKLETTNSRLCAKLLNKKSKAFLLQYKFLNAQSMLKKGFNALIENYDSTFQVLPTFDQIYPENTLYELVFQCVILHYEKYKISHLTGDLHKAQDGVNLALQINRLLGYTYFATPSKMLSIRQNKHLVDVGLDILYELSAMEGTDKWIKKINEMFDFSKSLNLLDRMSKNKFIRSLNPERRDSLYNFQQILSQLYSKKARVDGQFLKDSLSSQIFDIEGELSSRFGSFEVSVDYQIDHLPHFLEYVVTLNSVFSINNLNGKITFKRNGSVDEFNKLHDEFNKFILNKKSFPEDSILFEMHDFLLKDIDLKQTKIVVVPDGRISTISFDVLKGETKKYLIEDNVFFYALHKVQISDTKNRDEFEMIFTLNPNYGTKQLTSAERGGIYNLKYSKLEAASINELFPNKIISSRFTTDKDTIFESLKEADVFHFSGHAITNNKNAFLVLSEDENKSITNSEIAIQNLDLELVVLSACETGLGKLAYGDGLQSLARAFVQAGTKTVVNSLWAVNDRSTAEVMNHFYAFIKNGYSIDDALRKAKLQYLNTSPIENQHPYYWAGLIGLGDYSPIVSQKQPLNILYGALVILSLLFLFRTIYLKTKS